MSSRPDHPNRILRLAIIGVGCTLLAGLSLIPLAPRLAEAFPGGVFGRSGAGPSGTGGGSTCTACHDVPGVYQPTVSIDGPTEVTPGSTNDFSVLLNDFSGESPVRGGFNLAIADGTLDSTDTGVRDGGSVGNGELAHDGPRAFVNNGVIWDFEWEAPDEPGDYTMYVAAIAGSGDFMNDGNEDDNQALSTLIITVADPVPTFLRGDVDADGVIFPIVDAIFLLNWGFTGGDEPPCLDAADLDDDGLTTPIVDTVFLLEWQFLGGDAPPSPGPDDCGEDATDDDVGCEEFTCVP